jgi:hypothetical protein
MTCISSLSILVNLAKNGGLPRVCMGFLWMFVARMQRVCHVFDSCHGFVVKCLFQYTQLPETEVGSVQMQSPHSNLGEP